ncbi:MAG: 2-oxo-4-hydroxy-4-carboxy-5-ureidoimidazoline decarboxylase [Phormidesmis sp.]
MSCRSIAELNQLDQADFVNLLGAIFEETPFVAQQAWAQRPFMTVADLHQKMVAVVEQMSPSQQLALIRAHPQLGAKTKMAEASVQEQAGAGLHRVSIADEARIQELNQAYEKKFGFPFVMAVKGHTTDSILKSFERRLENEPAQEKARSLQEISAIARFRLDNLTADFPDR